MVDNLSEKEIYKKKILKRLLERLDDEGKELFNKYLQLCNINSDKKDEEVEQYSKLSINLTKSLTKKIKKENGIYFTPYNTIKYDIDFILSLNIDIKNVLEPSCGSCEFIKYLDSKINYVKFDCIEYNETIYNEIKGLQFNNNCTLFNDDFIKFDTNKKYDLIIGNPPYFNLKKNLISKEYLKYINGRANIYIIFILKCLPLLSDNGILSFVLPQNFLNCSYYKLVREKIYKEFTILNIFDHKNNSYIETEQKTFTLIIQKTNNINIEKRDLFTKMNKNNEIIFNTQEKILKLKDLEMNTTNIDTLGFDVSVGNVVWNQETDLLTNNKKDILIIYSSDIKDNKYQLFEFSNKSIKNGKYHYIKKSGLKNNQLLSITNKPMLVCNRGYGNGNFALNYALINENTSNDYLVENHVICIKPKKKLHKKTLIKLYNKIITSFNDPRTKEFVDLSFTNDAINCGELQYSLPIFE